MSYDLYFVTGDEPRSADAFFGYFRGRATYAIDGRQAWYRNEDTGVYYIFELSDPTDGTLETDDGEVKSWATFNLNYFRPHFFGSEALPELDAFVAKFDLKVHDPQIDGMGDGAFSADGFLRGWTAGNELACRTSTQVPGDDVWTRPAAELEQIWRWNMGRESLQEELGAEIFVPKIGFFRTSSGIRSASVWTDAIPVVLPKTGVICAYRDELAPRRWLRRRPGIAAATWSQATALLAQHKHGSEPLDHYYLDYSVPPMSVVDWVRSLPEAPDVVPVSADQVLDEELFTSR